MTTLSRRSLTGALLAAVALGCGEDPLSDPAPQVRFGAAATTPSGLTATPATARVEISWQDNSSDETGFEIHRAIGSTSSTFAMINSVTAGEASYADAGVAVNTQYCYRVRAYKAVAAKPREYTGFSEPACASAAAAPPPQPGSIRVTVATSGVAPDGFAVVLNNGAATQPTPANGSTTFMSLPAGSYSIALQGAGPKCSVDGSNPVTVSVTSGGVSNVGFSVTCPTSNVIRLTVMTGGVEADVDGYGAALWHIGAGGRFIDDRGGGFYGAPSNGTVDYTGHVAGLYEIEFDGIAPNCRPVSPNPLPVDAQLNGTVAVRFEVTCTPTTQLAFADTLNGNADIYTIRSNGTGRTRLTSQPSEDVEPAWSPDGRRIAFRSDRDGKPEIFVMNADGSNPVRLTSTGGAFRPAWSPSGDRIAFMSRRDGNEEVYVMNADGTGLLDLTNHPADDGDPAWSPDGGRIAFRSTRGSSGYPAIHLMNADGSGVQRLTADPYPSDAQPAWSRNGLALAFAHAWCGAGMCKQDILTMAPNGTGVGWVTVADGFPGEVHSDPVWSPDGNAIAFSSSASGIGIISLDGGGGRGIGSGVTYITTGFNPSWR